MRRRALLAMVSLLGLSACAWGDYGDYGDYGYGHRGGYAYRGEQWAPRAGGRRPYEGELSGPGVDMLDEWLRETREGRAILSLGFRDAREGHVSEDVAHRANIWFRRYADANRDMTITDPEIRRALVTAAAPHLRPR